MEYALWKGERISAYEVSQNYELEKNVRYASRKKELLCPDDTCEHRILRYCHGDKKEAFFAHLNNETCDYAQFDKNNPEIIKAICRKFFLHLTSIGINVAQEIKILKHHYTHLLITKTDGKRIAIEFGTKNSSAPLIDRITAEYRNHNIEVQWLVIGEKNKSIKENQVFHLKRYQLNESYNKELIVVSSDTAEITQYKIDPNEYIYNNIAIPSKNYPSIYEEPSNLEKLVLFENRLSIDGFIERYNQWLKKKKDAFAKYLIKKNKEQEEKRLNDKKTLYKQLSTTTEQEPSVLSQHNTQNKPLPKTGMIICHKKRGILKIVGVTPSIEKNKIYISAEHPKGEIFNMEWDILLSNKIIEIIE